MSTKTSAPPAILPFEKFVGNVSFVGRFIHEVSGDVVVVFHDRHLTHKYTSYYVRSEAKYRTRECPRLDVNSW